MGSLQNIYIDIDQINDSALYYLCAGFESLTIEEIVEDER